MKIVGIYAGHGTQTNGVWDSGTTYNGNTEAYFTRLIAIETVNYLKGQDVKILTDVPDNKMNMVKQVEMSNKGKADIHVAIHLDYYKAPKGTLPLYVSEKGRNLAATLNKYVIAETSLVTRGLGKRTDLYELNQTNMPACIFEVGSIKADLSTIKKEYKKIGAALGKGICSYLGIKATSKPVVEIKNEVWKPHKIVEDGRVGQDSIFAWQYVLKQPLTGKVGGQTRELADKHFPNFIFGTGKGGDKLIKAWQKKIGVSQDGIVGVKTAKATQKFLKVTQDGICGIKTAKALQKWLNVQTGFAKASTATTKTVQSKVWEYAVKLANDNSYGYKKWTSKANSHKCPICYPKSGKGTNCIGFAGICYRHGGGVAVKCSGAGIGNDSMFNKILTNIRNGKKTAALKLWTDKNGKQWQMISNSGKILTQAQLKKGDILLCYNTSYQYKHTALYGGGGQIADANSGTGISVRKLSNLNSKPRVAFRYTGTK